jgi:tetratricopeptide (TPR) repeat protein
MMLRFLRNLLRTRSQRDQIALDIALALVRDSQLQSANEVLDALLNRSQALATAWMLRGAVKRLLKDPKGAIPDLERALTMELHSDQSGCHLELAQCWLTLGEKAKALTHCSMARELDTGSVPAFFLLTQLRLPGEYYFDVLSRIIAHLKPKTYVEIGVFEGASLQLAKTAKAIVGIDPDPKITWPLPPHMKVFKAASDVFFSGHNLNDELGQRPVDLAFIDGMHQFEFAMRDFANVEACCRSDSVILIHDCFPLDEESAGREPRATRWSGDVWRLIVLLKKNRPDLLIHTIATAPTGLAVIQNLNPESTYLLDNKDRLSEEFLSLEYSYLDDDKAEKLNLFPNHWPSIQAMLRKRAR